MVGATVMVAGAGLVLAGLSSSKWAKPGGKILLIGDSMAEGLASPLKQLAAGDGVILHAVYHRGTRIDQWASDPLLPAILAEFQPDLVLVVLGTNDEYLPASAVPKQLQDAEALIAKMGAPVAWVGVPTLPARGSIPAGGSNGITPGIEALDVPVFPSSALQIQRAADQLHPTAAGAVGWATTIWEWLS